jgi:hypothetical protein
MSWEEKLKLYDELVDLCPGIERKGKKMVFTSDNGYMFSLLNKDGEFGIRLSKEEQEEFKSKFESGPFKSHGATMRDYVLVPTDLQLNPKKLAPWLKKSHAFVCSLPPK